MSVKTISEASNYTAINIGKLSELNQHVLTLPNGNKVPRKIFLGKLSKMTGSDISYTSLPLVGRSPYFHVHH